LLFYRIAHLIFWITATDQHGVHSPFVYRYVTLCLYGTPRFKVAAPTNILLKTITYFKLKEIELITNNERIPLEITTHMNGVSIVDASQKLIYLDILNDMTLDRYLINNDSIANDTILYIPEIYKDSDRNAFWKKIKALEKVSVSVDMFYGGLIFFRSEQAKEHFKIRI
jgi:hypothetical protein